jgi:hypothetical protein
MPLNSCGVAVVQASSVSQMNESAMIIGAPK